MPVKEREDRGSVCLTDTNAWLDKRFKKGVERHATAAKSSPETMRLPALRHSEPKIRSLRMAQRIRRRANAVFDSVIPGDYSA